VQGLGNLETAAHRFGEDGILVGELGKRHEALLQQVLLEEYV